MYYILIIVSIFLFIALCYFMTIVTIKLRKYDPYYNCELFLKHGCNDVGGPLCPFPNIDKCPYFNK